MMWRQILGVLVGVVWQSNLALAAVEMGIDQLFNPPYVKWIAGKRVGLVVNNASTNRDGVRDIDLFAQTKQATLVRIFTPEHGLVITEKGSRVKRDPSTQIGVTSLYSKKSALVEKRLKPVDVLVFDLQDVGLRYYTYTAMLAKALKFAKNNQKPLIVLDRVNPLGGNVISGGNVDANMQGNITSYLNVPTRYALTVGELARYVNKENQINADLMVVPLRNWQRSSLFNQTGLTWRAPSPRLVTFEQAYLYAVFGTLESTNLSVGMGQPTEHEFHYYGAPYISSADAQQILKKLQAVHLPGLTFRYQEWQPRDMQFKGKLCRGIAVDVTDYAKVQDFYSLITVLKIFREVLGTRIHYADNLDPMLGRAWIRKAIVAGDSTASILQRVKQEQVAFRQKRAAYLLYK